MLTEKEAMKIKVKMVTRSYTNKKLMKELEITSDAMFSRVINRNLSNKEIEEKLREWLKKGK